MTVLLQQMSKITTSHPCSGNGNIHLFSSPF
jgi:hypothetical protein